MIHRSKTVLPLSMRAFTQSDLVCGRLNLLLLIEEGANAVADAKRVAVVARDSFIVFKMFC